MNYFLVVAVGVVKGPHNRRFKSYREAARACVVGGQTASMGRGVGCFSIAQGIGFATGRCEGIGVDMSF